MRPLRQEDEKEELIYQSTENFYTKATPYNWVRNY